jgi:hypothetical protein
VAWESSAAAAFRERAEVHVRRLARCADAVDEAAAQLHGHALVVRTRLDAAHLPWLA